MIVTCGIRVSKSQQRVRTVQLYIAACSNTSKSVVMRVCAVLSMIGGSLTVNDESLVKEGWMWKRTGNSSQFKKRYFRLVNSQQHGARLYWFVDAFHVTHPKGQLPIGGADVVIDPVNRLLTVSSEIGVDRVFRCPGLGSLNEWHETMSNISKSQTVFTKGVRAICIVTSFVCMAPQT